MVRRSQRGAINRAKALDALATGRDGAIQICREAIINGPEYEAAGTVIEAIDNLAERLTGDRSHFRLGGHTVGRH